MPILKRPAGQMQALMQGANLRALSGKAGGLSIALLLAACATPMRPVGPPPPPPPVEAAPPPVAELPQVKQNRVALLVPLTGSNAPVGQSIANAANLALLDVGETRINLRVYDTAQGAGPAAARALADGAGLFLGPLLATDVRAVAAVAEPRGIPVISFSNDSSVAGGNVFVMGFQPAQSISRTIAYARSRGVERFAALVPSGVYGQRAQTAFVRAVEAAGGRSTAVVPYNRQAASINTAARTVTAFDARNRASGGKAVIRSDGTVSATASMPPPPFQALLIADSGTNSVQFLPALARYGAAPGTITLLGTELWNNEPGLARATALRGALFSAVPDENFKKLSVRYRTRFGGTPSRLASFGYDSVLLVNSLAGNWALGAAFPRRALSSREGFSGIDGAFRFTPGNVAERALEVQQIGQGTINTVARAPRGFTE